jgi:hypothetical protein
LRQDWLESITQLRLPIVLGDAIPPDPVASWGYRRVGATFDAETLDVIRRTAMQGVRTLPLDAEAPYQLEATCLRQYTPDIDT